MKIKLPPLPDRALAPWEVQAIQLETIRAVQEACAKVCDDIQRKSYLTLAAHCAGEIRALEFDV